MTMFYSRFVRRNWLWILVAIVLVLGIYLISRQLGFGTASLLSAGLLAMTPLALTAVGECINEQAGVVNIGLEGILLISAVAGVWGAEIFGSGVMGLAVGALAGALIGFVFGLLGVYGRADQIVAGVGINVFALGIVPYLLMGIWGMPGIHLVPKALKIRHLITPIGQVSWVTLVAIAVAILAQVFLHRSVLGFRIRATGENPEAVDVAGLRIDFIRLFTATLGGALCGLGGAFMPLAWFGGVVKEISAGRGFIALACVVFAGLEPMLALAAAFIFGFAEGFAFSVAVTPGVKEVIPFYFVNMIPYIVTLLIVAIAIGQSKFPAAIAEPYTRE